MKQQPFFTNKNFHLQTSNWGNVQHNDIVKLLDNVIDNFYSLLNKDIINTRPVYVIKETKQNCPWIHKGKDSNTIYLFTGDRFWSQYSYQFSHELCHHVIDSDFFNNNDKFGWLEESICELASISVMQKMSHTWTTNPPYPNWSSYAGALSKYVDDIVASNKTKIDKPFTKWLSDNINTLYKNRYLRTENTIIALALKPAFDLNPKLWHCIQYMKNIDINDSMGLPHFLEEWRNQTPDEIKPMIDEINTILI